MICVDASLVLALLLKDEDLSTPAETLFVAWQKAQELLVAPSLLMFEVLSGLRLAVYTNRIRAEDGDALFSAFQQLGIQLRVRSDLPDRMWEIGKRLNPPRLYDASYLALGEVEECEVWTADRRLLNLVGARMPRLRWVGQYDGSTYDQPT